MSKAQRFVSEPPATPFAPTWDFTIARKETEIDVKSLAEFVLQKEQEIIDEFPGTDDGQTGLGEGSLTARFKHFNALEWDHPGCRQLLEEIRDFHTQYHNALVSGGEQPKLKVRCWANVLRKGQKIEKHRHAIHPFSYVSGHYCVQCDSTSTVYVHEYADEVKIKNEPGQLTLFPTYLNHYTTEHTSDTPRITFAFDIVPTEGYGDWFKGGLLHQDESNLVSL